LNIEVNRFSNMNLCDVRSQVAALSGWVSDIAEHVHDLSHELHPSRPETLGLVPAVRAVCNEMSRQHGITVDLHAQQMPRALGSAVSLCAYRIVQEALHNVVKHSGATRASVELTGSPTAIELVVADQGRGFVPDAQGLAGLGLVSMGERVKLLDGEIAIDSSPGDGTRLRVRLPLDAAATCETNKQRSA
jgi:signal transduction histidine kinase